MREWFHARDCKIPNDPVLIGELSAPSYKLTSSGKISIESKDEMKARRLKSPNAADALALTFQVGDYSGRHRWQTHAISMHDLLASDEENAIAMARAEQRSGYFTGPGWAPTWHGDEQTQQAYGDN